MAEANLYGYLRFRRITGKLSSPYTLSYGITTIGSSTNARISLECDDSGVEDIHCSIEVNYYFLAKITNHSQNTPIKVNGAVVQMFQVLDDGDKIEIASVECHYFTSNAFQEYVANLEIPSQSAPQSELPFTPLNLKGKHLAGMDVSKRLPSPIDEEERNLTRKKVYEYAIERSSRDSFPIRINLNVAFQIRESDDDTTKGTCPRKSRESSEKVEEEIGDEPLPGDFACTPNVQITEEKKEPRRKRLQELVLVNLSPMKTKAARKLEEQGLKKPIYEKPPKKQTKEPQEKRGRGRPRKNDPDTQK